MKLTKRNLQKLTPDDRNEVEAFRELLRDMGAGLRGGALWDKWGESYLGPRPANGSSLSVHLYSQSQPCVIGDAINAYTKDGLYCVQRSSGAVVKFPLLHVFRIIEDGPCIGKSDVPVQGVSLERSS